MKYTTILGLLAVFALTSIPGMADAKIEEGTKEISAFGALSTTEPEEGDTTTQLVIQVGGGVFLDTNNQVGGSFTQASSESGGDTATLRVITGFFKHHLNTEEEAIPYLGGQGGMAFLEFAGESASSIAYGGMFGVKFFLSEELSMNVEYNLLFTTITYDSQEYDVTQTTIQAGMSYYF